jgi:hypothetical protein
MHTSNWRIFVKHRCRMYNKSNPGGETVMNNDFFDHETATTNQKTYKSSIVQLVYGTMLAWVSFLITLMTVLYFFINGLSQAKITQILYYVIAASGLMAVIFVIVLRTASVTVDADKIEMRMGRKRVSLPFSDYKLVSYINVLVSGIAITSRYIRATNKATRASKDYKCLNFGKKVFSEMMESVLLRQKALRNAQNTDIVRKSIEPFLYVMPQGKAGKQVQVTEFSVTIDGEEFLLSEISRLKVTSPNYPNKGLSYYRRLIIEHLGQKKAWKFSFSALNKEYIDEYKRFCAVLDYVFADRNDIYILEI